MKVIVIGGGPAGMMAAITAKKSNNEVTLLEKNATLGKKLSITGKGRCNITSSLENMDDFIKNTPGNGKFLYSSFRNFTNKDIIKLLDIPTKVERGNRIFPVSDKAQDVVNAFEKQLKGVKIIKDIKVEEILTENLDDNNNNCCNHNFNNNENENNNSKSTIIRAIGVKTNKGNYYADKIILATVEQSYKITWLIWDGYERQKTIGETLKKRKSQQVTITEIKPSLVAMTVTKNSLQDCQELQGLTLKNVSIQLIENKKNIYKDFGEMLFTHFGVSGPIILSASSHLVRTKMINPKIIVDMKPALSAEKLEDRILRDFKKYQNKEIKNALNDLLPQKMTPVIIRKSNINFEKKVNEITKEERKQLINSIKNFTIEIEGFRSIDEAIITAGGVSIKEINPKTMESKIVKGLYFAGEIIDVDAYTGGFNLQIAYSTGYTAGLLQ